MTEATRVVAVATSSGNNKYHSHSKHGSDFKIGMAAATYVGFANGSFMTPLKYANKVRPPPRRLSSPDSSAAGPHIGSRTLLCRLFAT